MESIHKTVLLNETIDGLNLPASPSLGGSSRGVVVDATFGGGGHSLEICKRYPKVKIIAFDQDKSVFEKAKNKFKNCDITFVNKNFRELGSVKDIDGIIFDLGLSSDQLESSERGFSFMRDEPLIMTMKEDPSLEDLTAFDVVNSWSEKSLANIIYGYGEERFSRKIAKGIVDARQKKKLETTFELVDVIRSSVPGSYRNGRLNCATKTFQALRIAVNDELGALQEGLEKGFGVLKKKGRMSVISFHSLEDRIVKRFYKDKEKDKKAKLINKKVILAELSEIKSNPRSRSAKLRILEKI